MQNEDHITHQGFVTDIRQNEAHITLVEAKACGGCHMRDFCSEATDDDKHICVPSDDLHVGDQVRIAITPHAGLRATFWAYVMPFLLMLSTLVVCKWLTLSDQLSALFALAILVPYFLSLSGFSRFFRKTIDLKVMKL